MLRALTNDLRVLFEDDTAPKDRFIVTCSRCKGRATVEMPRTKQISALVNATVEIHTKLPNGGFKNVRPLDLKKDPYPMLYGSIYCCNAPVKVQEIKGKYVKDIPCDARCTGAKGFQCNCVCGGKNHGRDFSL